MTINRSRLLATAALLAPWQLATPAFAQSEQAASASEDNGSDEIVVTARRRDEQLQDVPIAISVISADDLAIRQIDNVSQAVQSIPNLTYQTGAPTGTGGSTPSIFIRGIGSAETSLGTEPGVGLYVDDVYIARSVGSVLDLVDVDSVQVLRGPQGTLFGRNSAGGAILIRTRRPSDVFGGSLEVQTGRFGRFDVRGSLDIPIGSDVRLGLTAMRARRDGYIESDDGEATGNINRIAGRAVLEWQATPDLRITLAGDITSIDERALPGVLLGLSPNIPGTPVPSSIQAVSNLQRACGGASVLGNSGNPACIDQQFILGPRRTAGGYQTDNPIFDSQGSRPYGSNSIIDTLGVSGTIVWDISDSLTFKSITAYRQLDAFWTSNSDHTPNPGIETKNDQNQSQFTQEIQLLGSGQSFNWVVGGFFMEEEGDALNVVAFPDVIFRSGGEFQTRSWAAFAQGTYELAPGLDLTGGLRYTYELKKYDVVNNQQVIGVLIDPIDRIFLDFRANPIPFVVGATPNIESNEVTPHVSLSYDWSPGVMTYVSYSRGYKSGGYEQRLAPGTPEVPSFRPEFVDSYEAGLRISDPGNRLRLSAALFHAEYSDLQISVVDGPAPTLTNAGDATLNGAELEISIEPVRGLTLSGFGSYLDAEYDELTQRALNSGIRIENSLPNASRWQFGISVDGRASVGSNLEIRPHFDWSYRTTYFVDSANDPLLRQPGYNLINAAITLARADDRWEISLSGRNLLNETYLVSGIAQYNIGEIEGQYGRPREWALSAKIRF